MRHGTLIVIVAALLLSSPAWAWSIKHPVFQADLNISESSVQSYMSMTVAQLRGLITEAGPVADTSNVTAKQAAYDLARLYQKTKLIKYADRAVVLLERFAEVMPKWPIYTNDGSLKAVPITDVKVWTRWNARGLWNIWFHQDLQEARELALAYDFIADSGALQSRSSRQGKDVAKLIEDDLLRYTVEVSLHFNQNPISVGGLPAEDCAYGNMAGYMFDGTITFGRVVEPAFIHIVLRRMREQLWVGFFRDGAWHEGTPSYQRQTVGYSKKNEKALTGYSDPTGYTFTGYTTRLGDSFKGTGKRIDNLVPFEGLEAQWDRIKKAIDPVTFPNGIYYVIHDTHSTQKNWEFTPKQSLPACLFGMRHCVLGRFSGADQVQAHLHFGGTDGHEHYDCLNLGLWALGAELISEGEYKNFGNRPWNTATAGHNTVVVDEKNQNDRFDNRPALTVDDALDGIGFYRYQDYGHGDSRNFGNLRLWDATRPHLQVVEAEGENAYVGQGRGQGVTRYRRTLVMVEIQGTRLYLIDIFRVKGGTIHDWMLHGRLDEDYGLTTSLTLPSVTGQRFGFLILNEQATTDSTWHADFTYEGGARLRTTMLGQTGTEVSTGRAPAMRRAGDATFLDVRRSAGDSLFVAVHEPYSSAGSPEVTKVSPLLYSGLSDSVLALRIELQDGRTDIFALTLDEPPYPVRQIPGTSVSFQGRLAHLASRGETHQWIYLLEGSKIAVGDIELNAAHGDFSYRGSVTGVLRKKNGDAADAFVTAVSLPTAGLEGQTLLLTLPDGRTEGYTIEEVVAAGGHWQIQVKGDPGLELRDNGKLVKLVYFPHHGLRGALSFLIPGSVYQDKDGLVQSTAPVGPTVADGGVTIDGSIAGNDGGAPTDGAPEGDNTEPADGGCGCELAVPPDSAGPVLFLLLLLPLALRRLK